MASSVILNIYENFLCIIMSLILGQLLGLKMSRVISTVYSFLKNVEEPNCDEITMETNLNLNETLPPYIFILLGHF